MLQMRLVISGALQCHSRIAGRLAPGCTGWATGHVRYIHRRSQDEQLPGKTGRTAERKVLCAASSESPIGVSSAISAVKSFVSSQFVPLGLLTGVVAGLVYPETGAAAAHAGLSTYTTIGIFILSGLSLKRNEGLAALSSIGAFAYGMLSILLLTPLAALLVLALPLQPTALAVGLAVFCAMPTTLSTGIALTQAVGGNTAMALLLTLGSNMLAVVTVPFLLPVLLGPVAGGVALESLPLLLQLVKTVLLPTLVGMTCRSLVPGVASLVDGNRKAVSMLSTVLLSTVPWMQISAAASQSISVSPAALGLTVATGVGVHLAYLAFNSAMVHLLKLGVPRTPHPHPAAPATPTPTPSPTSTLAPSGPAATPPGPAALSPAAGLPAAAPSRPAAAAAATPQSIRAIQRAVILVTSQKTLPVAVAVLTQLTGILGSEVGLAALPCVLCHLGQNLTDSFLVSRWLAQDKQRAAAATAQEAAKAKLA